MNATSLRRTFRCLLLPSLLLTMTGAQAGTIFVDATKSTVTGDGWKTETGYLARQATWQKCLYGANGAFDSTATQTITVTEPGKYRVWVRYLQSYEHRGPFHAGVFTDGKELAGKDFDVTLKDDRVNLDYIWDSFDADLPAGAVGLTISKTDKTAPYYAYTRAIDCLLLTTDLKQAPDATPYGPQLYVRITFGAGHEKPFYVHIFGNYYRATWYGHYCLSKDGLEVALQPAKGAAVFFDNGERTGWINISKLMYFDSGVNLTLSARYAYGQTAPRLNAKFEFASAPDEKAVVKTIERDVVGQMHIIVPPGFTKPENAAKFATDLELAERYGKIADAMKWPTVGKPPDVFPFFVIASLPLTDQQTHPYTPAPDKKTFDREWKTLNYFGYSNLKKTMLGSSTWNAGVGTNYSCYIGANTNAIRAAAKTEAEDYRKIGKPLDNIAYDMTMDEPGGPPVAHLIQCPICGERFRQWLKEMPKTPAELGVADWTAVKPVDDKQKDAQPALFFYTQEFRTYALSKFLREQREALESAFGAKFPVNVNFSDGAVYVANFGCMGVDYFDLLDTDDQNSIWSEDWANGSSTRQVTGYNSEVMRSAALKHSQTVGQYLIGYSGRRAWSMKIYTASHAARDNKVFSAYWYGPVWSSHEAGPPWQNHSMQAVPDCWYGNAEIVREIGGAEDLLYPAKKRKSEVAILYSSSADIWEMGWNYAYGFERMHTWLALAHRQIPVDFLSEKNVAEGELNAYKVCHLSGTRLARATAEQLRDWVKHGGTLIITAGAAIKDEFNRPLTILDEIRPAVAGELQEPGRYLNSGRYLDSLTALDTVTITATGAKLEVLSAKQVLEPKPGAEVLGTFTNGTAAVVRLKAGQGLVYSEGFLPAIAYMKQALIARNDLLKQAEKDGTLKQPVPDPGKVVSDELVINRSGEPWQYPAEYRDFIVQPVLEARPNLPVQCSVPLVDAVAMDCDLGTVVPVANYTLQPLKEVTFTVQTLKPVKRVESVHRGSIKFKKLAGNRITFTIPLQETDFVKLYTTLPKKR